MSKVNMSNLTDNVKTFVQGALGAMTFGMYHQYTSNRLIDLSTRQMQTEMDARLNQKEFEMGAKLKQKDLEMDAKLCRKDLEMDARLSQKELETDAKLNQTELEIQELRESIAQLQRRWF